MTTNNEIGHHLKSGETITACGINTENRVDTLIAGSSPDGPGLTCLTCIEILQDEIFNDDHNNCCGGGCCGDIAETEDI
jgi:hypothetical protein